MHDITHLNFVTSTGWLIRFEQPSLYRFLPNLRARYLSLRHHVAGLYSGPVHVEPPDDEVARPVVR